MRRIIAGFVLLALAAGSAFADVKPASLFQNNMVLQQEMKVPVWGTADPGEAVTVQFLDQTVKTTAGDNGEWMVALQPLKMSRDPQTLTISGKNTITIKNVLVGEVWVCSGQSNMEFSMYGLRNKNEEIAAADHPLVRLFTVTKLTSPEPVDECGGQWDVCSPDTVGSFSAVGYFFARYLVNELNVPFGMIHSSWGGTPAESWTPRETMKAMEEYKDRITDLERRIAEYNADPDAYLERLEKIREESIKRRDAFFKTVFSDDIGGKQSWMDPATDITAWKETAVPTPRETMQDYLGIMWVRRTVEIPAEWVGKDLTLNLGPIDDYDAAYVNGTVVGKAMDGNWNSRRAYTVPAKLVDSQKLTVTVAVLNTGGPGGLFGQTGNYTVRPAGAGNDVKPVELAGTWRYAIGDKVAGNQIPRVYNPPLPGKGTWDPSSLYNGMIHPLIPFAIRGAIWYQGEANAGAPELYAKIFPEMIKAWRTRWNEGDFPFIFVQLANFMQRQTTPIEPSSWADLRGSQTQTLSLPNTGMAVIIDIGEANDIHPKNKQDVGKRLALWALANTYGRNIEYYGPFYKSMTVNGNKVTVNFDHVGSGMVSKGEPLVGFAVAGADKVFHKAQAEINGSSVIVWSDTVAEPVAVRYGWANNPICNLYNKEGIPASPFRTDDWSRGEVKTADETLSEPVVEQ